MGEKETAGYDREPGSGMATGKSMPGKRDEQELDGQDPPDLAAAEPTQDTFKKMKDSVIQNIR